MSQGKIKGRFSKKEDAFLRKNYKDLTDKEMATALNRSVKSVTNRRNKLSLTDKNVGKDDSAKSMQYRMAFLNSLDDDAKREEYLRDLKRSALYKETKRVLTKREIKFYEETFVNFLMDPTIETMTVPERDALHDMTIAQIMIFRLLEWEKREHEKGNHEYSKAKDIREQEDVIKSCRKSLNVERQQRMKNQNDSVISFANVIKELKNPDLREKVGLEAAMFKYIAEKKYNEMLKKSITSGQSEEYDLSIIFKDGKVPDELSGEFLEANNNSGHEGEESI